MFIELSDGDAVRPEAYRQYLRYTGNDQRQVVLMDFADTLRAAMPAWLRSIVQSLAPPQAGEPDRPGRQVHLRTNQPMDPAHVHLQGPAQDLGPACGIGPPQGEDPAPQPGWEVQAPALYAIRHDTVYVN